MARAQASVTQAKTLSWRNRGGGEPHWDAALQHPQARQFKQKLAKFCNIPRSECPSCPARRAATLDASCLHLSCVVLPFTGQEGKGQAQSQGQDQSEGAMTICIVMSLPLQAEFVFRHVLKTSTGHFYVSSVLVLHDLHMGRDMHIEI